MSRTYYVEANSLLEAMLMVYAMERERKMKKPKCDNCYDRGYIWAISMGGGRGVPGRSCFCAAGKKRDRELDQTRECGCVPVQVAKAVGGERAKEADPNCSKCGGVGLW